MQFFNLLNVDPSSVIDIKDRYENALKSTGRLDDTTRLSIDEMIRQIDLTHSILVKSDGKIIPFSIQDIASDFSYVFFTADDDGEDLRSSLDTINYDLSKLTKLSNDEVMQRELLQSGTPFFIIDSTVCII